MKPFTCVQKELRFFKNVIKKVCLQIIINMYKYDLELNNIQSLICHKTPPNKTKSIFNTQET